MPNKYLTFISDEHLLACVETMHKAYIKAKKKPSKKSFYKNKVDSFKMTFDAHFNEMTEEELIQAEILRQIDKSTNNSIGTFHEQVLGGIQGYETGKLSGYDVRAINNTLFADIKNKHNTMNSSSSEALFQKLARYADDNKQAKCYWVQILAKDSFAELWKGDINGKEYSHSRVYKISGDQFYALLTGEEEALYNLYKVLPTVIGDYLKSLEGKAKEQKNSVLQEIKEDVEKSGHSILDQITLDNYEYYKGFDKL